MKWLTARTASVAVVSCLLGAAGAAQAGWPWSTSESHEAAQANDEWYAIRASDPVGARQQLWKGKLWPPFPRPTGPAQLPSHRYHAAHYWPYPYNCQDRKFVQSLSQSQVNNGWVRETTLYDYHFDPDSESLNRAGRLHLRWILENAPALHRVAFVQAGDSSQSSQARMDSVKAEAVAMVGDANVPPIMLRIGSPAGRAADEVDRIRRLERESAPKPRISNPLGNDAAVVGSATGQ